MIAQLEFLEGNTVDESFALRKKTYYGSETVLRGIQ